VRINGSNRFGEIPGQNRRKNVYHLKLDRYSHNFETVGSGHFCHSGSMKHSWTREEDAVLIELVAKQGKQWGAIAAHLQGRTASQVAARWEKCLDPRIHKGPFTTEEDQIIVNYVSQNGARCWPRIAGVLPNRSPKQCRERWFNHLDPAVVKAEWSPHEDELIFQQFQTIGGKWSLISKLFPGRSDNAIKNRWNSSVSKRIQINAIGQKFLTPDSTKRKYRTKERVLPPAVESHELPPTPAPTPIPTPEKKVGPKLEIPPSSLSPPPLPFPPFTIPATPLPCHEGAFFSPGGFKLSPIGLGALACPRVTYLLSTTKKDESSIQLA
jgi:hypothetical protein